MKKPIVAIVGNPNCGKTTLFNGLTGARQKIGNWPGVTVEKKEGIIKKGEDEIVMIDLPGIYSLSAYSEDEKIARDYILGSQADLIVNIVDAVNLERNLYLTIQLAEMGLPLLVVINRADIAEKNGIKIDVEHLSKHLSCPVIMISALKSQDVKVVADEIFALTNLPICPSLHVNYPQPIELLIKKWAEEKLSPKLQWASRWVYLKIIEGDLDLLERSDIGIVKSKKELLKEVGDIISKLEESPDIEIADARYAFIHGIILDVIKSKGSRSRATDFLDSIALNRLFGIPIFLFIIYLLFWITIKVGSAFIDFFDIAVGTLFVELPKHLLSSAEAPLWLSVVIGDGIGTGIQTVATFIPVIFTMFFMLSILEDSGYMARAAFVMDRFMRSIGLPGKAFVPMIVGFGCSVPAVMGSRTLESKKDRLLTIFMTPFMSCGAKLPVYVLFAAAIFPANSGVIVFAIYLSGIAAAIVTGYILKTTLFQGEASHFVMELPLYNIPRPKTIFIHTWNRLKMFLLRASKVIISAVFILSLLNSTGTDGSFGNEESEKSLLAAISQKITPVFTPMGVQNDNWQASVSIFTGLFAKEAIVGTLNSLYSQEKEETSETPQSQEEGFSVMAGLRQALHTIPQNLRESIKGITDPLGTDVLKETGDSEKIAQEIEIDSATFERLRSYFTPIQAFAFLLFILLYFPCVAAFGAIVKEAGIRLALFQSAYLTIFAWIVATIFYQLAEGHSLFWIIIALSLMMVLVAILYILGKNDFANLKEEK
ncbi:MAG TPA: Fe(2+) transporter permease subunit FeoB [Spirochaetota bacterium]|nr:Fe(2+) transporter permease subunit FeoB [Spirochaetota bacterium]